MSKGAMVIKTIQIGWFRFAWYSVEDADGDAAFDEMMEYLEG
jgi:hypothetical protein